MDELISILSKYSLEDAIEIEQSDRQFLAIRKIHDKIWDSPYYYPLIIANSLVGYQLSSTGEEYWEEFAEFVFRYKFPKEFKFDVLSDFFQEFLPLSKWNKRILNMKIPRLKKTVDLFGKIIWNEEYLYKNLLEFQAILSKYMKQQKDAKTLLFALKMFHYAARIWYWYFVKSPFEIWIPVDSRLTKISDRYNTKKLKDQEFWMEVSRLTDIPCLHLDAILWTRCNDFICF